MKLSNADTRLRPDGTLTTTTTIDSTYGYNYLQVVPSYDTTAPLVSSTLSYYYMEPQLKLPTQVNFHPEQKAVVLYFGKDKQVVRATEGDEYDKLLGFLLAYFHQHSGLSKNKANKYLDNILKEEE